MQDFDKTKQKRGGGAKILENNEKIAGITRNHWLAFKFTNLFFFTEKRTKRCTETVPV